MDLSTSVGLIFGVGALLVGFILEKGSLGSLMQISAILIVFGGTAGAVITSFPLNDLRNFSKWIKVAFTNRNLDLHQITDRLVFFATKARREGLLSLEQDLAEINDSFTYQGMQLVIDGTDPETTRNILEANIEATSKRHHVAVSAFDAAGGYAPTMGIIGTVMGLIQVLGNLEDPSALSHSIAAAFTATLYGVASANLIWLPIATKLKVKDQQEKTHMELIMEGIISIQAGENPSVLREKLKTNLSPLQRSNEPTSSDLEKYAG